MNGLPWKRTKISLSFLRLHPSTAFQTLLLTMMATPFLLRAMLSKSLIQFSDGHSCVLSLLFDLRPNYGGSNEDNSDLLQKVPCTHSYTRCPQPCSRSLLTQTSTGDSWTLTGKSGSVSCGVTAPFSWVLVCTRFCLCSPRVCFPVL